MSIIAHGASAQVFSVAAGTDFGIKAGTNFVADSMDLVPSADFTLNGNTLTRTKVTNVTTPFLYVTSVYQLATTSQAYSGSVKFNYSNAALNGISTSTLALNIYNGSSWNGFAATSRGNNNVLTNINSVAFNQLTLADLRATIPTWTGSSSTSWSNVSNWYGGLTPTTGSSVYIPAAPVNQPVLDANASIGGLELKGNLTLADKTLTLTSSLNGSGTFKGTSASTLVLNANVDSLFFDATYNGANLTIPRGVTAKLGNSITTYNLALNGTLDLNKKSINLNGAITGSGLIKSTTASSITINSNVGTINFDPTSNNAQNLTIVNGAATLGSSLNLYNKFTPTAGTFNTGGYLTLKSTSVVSSAVVDQVGATINGNVTVERFIPAGYRAYRDLSPGVYNDGNSLFSTWQESGSYTNNGYGMFVTGITSPVGTNYSSNYNDVTGLDATKNSIVSAYLFDNNYTSASPFIGITNTKNTLLNPFQSYRVLVRGDRSFDLYTTPIVTYGYILGLRSHNATTLRATGNLVTGTVTYSTTKVNSTITGDVTTANGYSVALNSSIPATINDGKGFSMIANPYICPVAWNNGSGVYNNSGTANIDATYWYLDPTSSANYQKYISCAGLFCNTYPISAAYIQPNQSVFVHTTIGAPSTPGVEFRESNKITSDGLTPVFGLTPNNLSIALNRKIDSSLGYQKVDCANLLFNTSYNNGLGKEDGEKIEGVNDNLSLVEGSHNLSIDGRKIPVASDSIGIVTTKMSNADYQFAIDASSYQSNGLTTYFYDAYTKLYTPISEVKNSFINFKVDTSNAASFKSRFSIVFKTTTLPISNITVFAKQTNAGVIVSWIAIGATTTTSYTVEKSTDGIAFTTLATTSTTNYTDNFAVGKLYYRIKVTDIDGNVTYSNSAKLSIFNDQFSMITAFPNPMVGKTLNISFVNVAKGNYSVTITNLLGQKVLKQSFNFSGGNFIKSISTGVLAKGVYNLVVNEEGGKQVYQANLEAQ